MPDIAAIQEALRAQKLGGWLFYDFRQRDPIATRVLGLGAGMFTRRWFYLIPARGTPRKLVHKIESRALDSLPGAKLQYASLEELDRNLRRLLRGAGRVAMQYSPRNAIPYVSMVDAGTIEMVRGAGAKVVSSADLVQRFEATWSAEQLRSHQAAGRVVDSVLQEAFARASSVVRSGGAISEYELQQWILEQFRAGGVTTEEPPIVAVGPHSGDPHYEPTAAASAPIRAGDLLLLDMWAKTEAVESVYYDITWVGFLGAQVPEKYAKVFAVVRAARDAAVAFVQQAVKVQRQIQGWQVDRAAREVIRKARYAKQFVHRTGHSIGQTVHGNGANMDSLETRDIRLVLPHTCFSIEPGIYLPEFGIRSEVNVFVDEREARVTGPMQTEIIALMR
ncbi:MAG: M24 family metallopeptidase [Candidatus Acidiferrales bacterium]|jgi:Xaa-Pro aminopeptidase